MIPAGIFTGDGVGTMLALRISIRARFRRGGIALAVSAAVMAAPGAAQAFYWFGWPGSGMSEPPSITPRQCANESPQPETPFGPRISEVPPETPKNVPEPATIVIAGLGLGVVGMRKWMKRQK